jgi:hypothetical protein
VDGEMQRLHWIVSLIEKILFFLFQFSLILLVLYGLGNFQEFLDRSQDLILQALTINTILGAILSIYWILHHIFAWVLTRNFRLTRFMQVAILLLYNAALLVILKFFISWFQI